MNRDIRDTALYREAEVLHRAIRQPGSGQISDASEVHVSTDGQHAVFSGTIVDDLENGFHTRICTVDLRSAALRVLTFGPNSDRLPKYSPVAQLVAFLSDRHRVGDFQLYLLDPITGVVKSTPAVNGCVEYLHWSPDGARILLGVAGNGADVAGVQGAVAGQRGTEALPSWLPILITGEELDRWRATWVYELESDQMRRVTEPGINVWEAVWCGNSYFAVVASSEPTENDWYRAILRIVEMENSGGHELYFPRHQVGGLSASPSGDLLAFIEAICSDRGLVAGDLHLINTTTGAVRHVDTLGVDVTYTEWRADQRLLIAGHRGNETVIASYDAGSETTSEIWSSPDVTTGGFYATVSGLNSKGDCVLIGESFLRAPEIATIRAGRYKSVRSFDVGYLEQTQAIAAVRHVSWQADDGLEIHGWLILPKGSPPHPVIMNLHGGPVWHWRPIWLGRKAIPILMLLRRGYAIFFPNPRGSSGRGQAFARQVLGDMGGADARDYLSGIDALVDQGLADPKRLGVTGLSYGGFITSWLITQDARFAAAVSISPHTNFITYHLLSNIPQFTDLFLMDSYTNPGGKYFQRSPVMHAHNVSTPTLHVCGALDRCTPPEEAVQFHNALRENGVKSALVTYPEEGHGIRKYPAAIDYGARMVSWFEDHMP